MPGTVRGVDDMMVTRQCLYIMELNFSGKIENIPMRTTLYSVMYYKDKAGKIIEVPGIREAVSYFTKAFSKR